MDKDKDASFVSQELKAVEAPTSFDNAEAKLETQRDRPVQHDKTSDSQCETTTDPTRSRKRQNGQTLGNAYKDVSFAKLPSTGRPDSPHRFFSSSFVFTISAEVISTKSTGGLPPNIVDEDITILKRSCPDATKAIPQSVHQHVNGLCIVTAGDVRVWMASLYPNYTIESAEIVVKEAPVSSAAQKRKQQAKMLKGRRKVEHIVTPSTVIAKIVLQRQLKNTCRSINNDREGYNCVTLPLFAGVWGTILEVNNGLTPQLLMDDSLLDGYLAVVLPTGRFPPKSDSDFV